VTPEERAARDRIAALLDHWGRDPLTAVFGSGDAATAFREDLRVVVVALDRYDGYEQAALRDLLTSDLTATALDDDMLEVHIPGMHARALLRVMADHGIIEYPHISTTSEGPVTP